MSDILIQIAIAVSVVINIILASWVYCLMSKLDEFEKFRESFTESYGLPFISWNSIMFDGRDILKRFEEIYEYLKIRRKSEQAKSVLIKKDSTRK